MEVEAATQGDGDGCDPGSRFRPPPTAERRHLPRAPMDTSGGPVFQSPATEDETIARKRSRRVSFADTTAFHVFDRDEDFESPPEERPASPSPSPGSPLAAEGDETEGEEEFVRPPVVFLGDVDLGSASPASAARSFSSFDGGNLLLSFVCPSTTYFNP